MKETLVDRWRCGGCDLLFRQLEEATRHHREVHPGYRIYYDPEWFLIEGEEE